MPSQTNEETGEVTYLWEIRCEGRDVKVEKEGQRDVRGSREGGHSLGEESKQPVLPWGPVWSKEHSWSHPGSESPIQTAALESQSLQYDFICTESEEEQGLQNATFPSKLTDVYTGMD